MKGTRHTSDSLCMIRGTPWLLTGHLDFCFICMPQLTPRFTNELTTVIFGSLTTHTAFPLESEKRTYTYILTWNFGRSSFLTAITSKYWTFAANVKRPLNTIC